MSFAMESLGINQLSREERIELVLDIWDSVAAESESISLSESQVNELRRRVADDEANPDDVVSWAEVQKGTMRGLAP